MFFKKFGSLSREAKRHLREIYDLEDHSGINFLGVLLEYAKSHVPYYGRIINEISEFGTLPLLTKELIRKNFLALCTDEIDKHKTFKNSSGGSTGAPQAFIQDKESAAWGSAAKAYYHQEMLGIDYDRTSKIILWGSERDLFAHSRSWLARFDDWANRTVFVNSFNLTPRLLLSVLHKINSMRPVFIRGYASSLYELARYIKKHGGLVHRPNFLYSSAETLQSFMRRLMEEVFDCQVYNFYGSREVGPIAGECRKGALHLFSFHNHTEILDFNNRPVSPRIEGKVIVTTLHNFVMPLIRYEIGDRAILGAGCSCGNNLPTLISIIGRITDNFLKRDGTIVHGEYFTHLFYFRDWVYEFQVLQEDYNRISIYVVLGGQEKVMPENDKREIESKIRLVMSPQCVVLWNIVESVPRTTQGKLIFTRSLLYER